MAAASAQPLCACCHQSVSILRAAVSWQAACAVLLRCAGVSVQFGQTGVISNNGVFIAIGTAANNNAYYNLVYMYKKDVVTGRFRYVC